MFVVQFLDHEEGSRAMWRNILREPFDTRDNARVYLHHCRATDDEHCLYSYRIVEIGSAQYYSQPTDALEC
jgi:hypothetical protein